MRLSFVNMEPCLQELSTADIMNAYTAKISFPYQSNNLQKYMHQNSE